MSAQADTFLDDLQTEMVALCQSDAVLGALPILDERKGDIIAEKDKALGLVTKVGGKIGACIIVQQMTADDNAPAAPGGQLDAALTFLVCEEPVLNDGANGFQIRALKICRRLVRVVKLYAAQGLCTAIVPMKPTIVPAAVEGLDVSLAYQVRFGTSEMKPGNNLKVTQPTLVPNSGVAPQTVTITTGTAGADIYYTLDGSHPWSGNSHATLYTAPVTVPAAGTLRARAFKAGYVGSNASAADFT